jgi:hypothetical protein
MPDPATRVNTSSPIGMSPLSRAIASASAQRVMAPGVLPRRKAICPALLSALASPVCLDQVAALEGKLAKIVAGNGHPPAIANLPKQIQRIALMQNGLGDIVGCVSDMGERRQRVGDADRVSDIAADGD